MRLIGQVITFYHEFKDKRRSQGSGNCVATFGSWSLCGGKLVRDAVIGIFDQPNSPVGITAVAKEYLRDLCRRVRKRAARKLHRYKLGNRSAREWVIDQYRVARDD